ncbi:MAG: KH domain-containing protein [Coriobacteriia bacterium]|nr:KH domain-containing protein [Coriobacteriia bacterium]MCL2749691.1 KH domain-containing protein [Coriobacteriia bacterium]
MSFDEESAEVAETTTEETDEQSVEEAYDSEDLDEAYDESDDDEIEEELNSEDESEDIQGVVESRSYGESPELSDEELDQVADTALETLRSLLSYFDAEDAAIDEYEGEDGELILDVVGGDLAVLIGRYGKTLDALQFLVASIVNKKIGFRYPIIVDIEGYRHRRRQKLESMAKASAARCIRGRCDVRLRPMTPYERRIIHIILRNERRVLTESDGEEPNRCVVVKLSQQR